MKKILALLLAAIMVLSMAACTEAGPTTTNPSGNASTPTPEKPQEVTLKVWGPSEDQATDTSWLQTRLAAFEKAHPEYKITWQLGVCPEGDAKTMVTTDVSAAADVFMYANDQLGTLIEAEALAELGGSYLDGIKANYSQTLIDTVTYTDGGVYGFPFTNNTWFLYYDKSVYTEEDVKSMETLLEKGKVAFPITNSWYIWSFYAAAGGTLFGPNGIDADAGIELGDKATDVTKYLVNMCAHPNFVNDVDNAGLDGIKDGSIKAYFDGSWNAKPVKDALGDNMGAAQLPTITINGEQLQMKAFAGSKAIGVNRQSKNMKVALMVAEFLASPESQLAKYEMRGVIPCASKLLENETIKADIIASAEANTMNKTACGQPTIPEMSNYWTPAANMGTAIYNKEVTLDNAQEQTELLESALNKTGL